MSIKIQLYAGLGNQLFMIFATISYAIDNNLDFRIISYLQKTVNGTPTYWDTILDSLKDNVDENVKTDVQKYSKVYKEELFEYIKLPDGLCADTDCVLHGYFQSHKYFEHNYERILDMLKFKEKKAVLKNTHKDLFAKKSIAVHFRIGDYIGLQMYHCIKRPEYYIHALKKMGKDLEEAGEDIRDYNILYYCQAQDMRLVDEFLKIISNITHIEYNFIKVPDDIDDWKQLLLMSLSDHFIIANSSFSWFGAYLSENKNKIVIRPRQWFGPANASHNIEHLCPIEWKVIDH
jgi:hypothetical protein